MSVESFLIIVITCSVLILICRVLPAFVLRGRNLPKQAVRALNLVPPAAFAALIANDLFMPGAMVSGDVTTWLTPLLAAAVVVVVGVKTKSMAWCIVVGVGAFALLMALGI
jgi:branched-subunit amino acid transport protein